MRLGAELFDLPLIAGLATAGDFVTAAEEQALLALQAKQLAEIAKAREMAHPAVHVARTMLAKTWRWPKVVVRGAEICVPVLEKSEAEDWKDHLTCYKRESSS